MNKGFQQFLISEDIKIKLSHVATLQKELAIGKKIQDILEFSNETMANFYRAAYHLFENKQEADAANAFVFLVTLNPNNHDYWLGLGMATQRCGDYEAAIDAYEMAAMIEIDSPVPYFYLAKCLFAIHDRDSSLQALDLAIDYSNERIEFFDLNQQAVEARKLLMIDHER